MSVGAGLVTAGTLILTKAPESVNITGIFLVAAGLIAMVFHEKFT